MERQMKITISKPTEGKRPDVYLARVRKLAEQIKARCQVSESDDEKELRRQMAHIASLADEIIKTS